MTWRACDIAATDWPGELRFNRPSLAGRSSSLHELTCLIDWVPVDAALKDIYTAAKGEPGWPPLHDLSDVKLAESLDDRSSFRRFCGFSASEPTPERTAFVRFRKALVEQELDKVLFEAITAQLKANAIRVKAGTLVDATIIASASEEDDEARWVEHKGKPADQMRAPFLCVKDACKRPAVTLVIR